MESFNISIIKSQNKNINKTNSYDKLLLLENIIPPDQNKPNNNENIINNILLHSIYNLNNYINYK